MQSLRDEMCFLKERGLCLQQEQYFTAGPLRVVIEESSTMFSLPEGTGSMSNDDLKELRNWLLGKFPLPHKSKVR